MSTTARIGTRAVGTAGLRAAAWATAVAMLAGCSALSGPVALDTYDLTVPVVSAAGPARPMQVLVPEPVVDRVLDGDRIVVRPSATEVAYFGGAQWSDRLPRLVQSRLIAALEASGRFRAVGRPGQGFAIDRQIVVDLRAFDYRSGEGRVEVVAVVRLMDDRDGRAAGSRVIRAEEPVAGDTARAVVAAFDAAFGRVAGEIVAFAAR